MLYSKIVGPATLRIGVGLDASDVLDKQLADTTPLQTEAERPVEQQKLPRERLPPGAVEQSVHQ